MKGSIYKRKGSSRWYLSIDVGRDLDGKRQRETYTFATRREAESAQAKMLRDLELGTHVKPTDHTVAEWLSMWLEGKQRLKQTTRSGYEIDIRRINKVLGSRRLRDLTPALINRFYADLAKTLAPKTVRNTHGTLYGALQAAVDQDLLARNPAGRGIELPEAEHKEMKVWSTDELRTFLQHASEHRLYPAILLAASSGLRRSEVLGLRWRNVDLEKGRAVIRDTVVPVNGEVVFREGVTKSDRSQRVISLDPAVVQVLTAHRKTQREEMMANRPLWTDMDLCFTNEIGEPVKPDTFTRTWKRLATEAGVPPLTPHAGARHGWATLALENGVPMKVVQTQLGHSSMQITADLYSHVSEDLNREAVEKVMAAVWLQS